MGVRRVTVKPGDVRAEHAPHAGTDPTSPWEALGMRVARASAVLGGSTAGASARRVSDQLRDRGAVLVRRKNVLVTCFTRRPGSGACAPLRRPARACGALRKKRENSNVVRVCVDKQQTTCAS